MRHHLAALEPVTSVAGTGVLAVAALYRTASAVLVKAETGSVSPSRRLARGGALQGTGGPVAACSRWDLPGMTQLEGVRSVRAASIDRK
jgi:hypothetical protein